jgi:hypothetical protein
VPIAPLISAKRLICPFSLPESARFLRFFSPAVKIARPATDSANLSPNLFIEEVWRIAMNGILPQRVRYWSLIAAVLCAWRPGAPAEPIPVRHVQGTIHGFLELRSEEGHVLASGDLIQVAHGGEVTTRVLFRFKDGSIDDETTVYSQRHNFQLMTDHHIQKGPFFPQPMDVLIDSRSGRITVRSVGKDGNQEVRTERLDLPPDLANGMVPLIVENLSPGSPGTTVSMLVATPKPRMVKLVISSQGEDPFLVVGSSHKAIRDEIKIELGGLAGIVAPIIGKQPPDIQVWTTGGEAPTLIREKGPIYPDGPIMIIELASPVWPDAPTSGN